jgi:hypothetical protein
MSQARISQQELEPLPRWARLALAARCLRRARALIDPPAGQARVLDEVLTRLDQATDTAAAGDDLAGPPAAAYTLALDNVDGAGAGDEDAVVLTCMVAHAAAFAAEAATLPDPRQAAHLVAQSVDFAVHAYRLAARADAGPALAAMRSDLERLRSEAGSWGDQTPLPEGFFPPL